MTPPASHATPFPDRPAKDESAADWKAHPFLQGLSAEHLATLAECAMPTNFKAEQVIFREGEMANRFYLILEGRVDLDTDAPDHPPVPVDSVTTGDVLGWSWLFPPYTWNFTARAVGPVRAIFFYGTWLRECCATDPALGYEIMRRTAGVVIRRLQATRQQLVCLAAGPGLEGG
jgi:CRP/FNR family transcriptional regulator, cyclic AMP receptor protein